MKLDPIAFAYATAGVYGGSVLLVGLANLCWPNYGRAFLECLTSVYPGYHAQLSLESVLVGTGYAIVDGGLGGWLLGWMYNRLAKSSG